MRRAALLAVRALRAAAADRGAIQPAAALRDAARPGASSRSGTYGFDSHGAARAATPTSPTCCCRP
jgi:hypothetical protein